MAVYLAQAIKLMELSNRNERILLFLLATVQFTNMMDFMIMMPLNVILGETFKISQKQFSLLVASYNISAFVSGISAAFLVDKYDRKKVLLFVYAGFIIGTIACALSPNYAFFLAARIVAGFFGGIIGAQVLAIVSDVVPYERRGMAMGVISTAFSLSTIFGIPFGLLLNDYFGWHSPFIFIAGLSTLILVLLNFFVPSIRSHMLHEKSASAFSILPEIARDRNLQAALLLMFTVILGNFLVIPFISKYMVGNVGFETEQLKYIYLTGGLASMISAPIVGRLSDKLGKAKVYITTVVYSFVPLFIITNLGPTPIAWALVVTTLFFVAGARMIPAQAMVSGTVHPKERGSFMNINSALTQLAAGIATVIGGMIVSENADGSLNNYNIVGYLSIIICASSLWFALRVKPKEMGVVKG